MLRFNKMNKTKPKLLINIGCLLDIPTGDYIIGKNGESILNGGLGQITGIVGPGNNYKSTLLHDMMLRAAGRMMYTADTDMNTYDTEVNVDLDRLERLAAKVDFLPEHPITGENIVWSVTDKSLQTADEWAAELVEYVNEKAKDKKSDIEFTAFKDPYSKKPLVNKIPSFVEIDSFSEFEAESTVKLLDKDMDDKSTNTMFMKQGLFKTKFLGTLPRLANTSNTYFLITAHIGEKINMDTGPAMYNIPTKKLQYLKQGDAIKGVSNKFFFLLNNGWYAHTARLLINKSTRLPEYPKHAGDTLETELNKVKIQQLRSKTGSSGYNLEIVVSQIEGSIDYLTHFDYIKENNRFGLVGNNIHYSLALMPDIKLSRPTVRLKLRDNKDLQRAAEITADLLQIKTYHPKYVEDGLWCDPETLYNDIKNLGYDWDILLKSRNWWTIDQYNTVIPFLSTMDLLRMRKGLYKPYWYKKEIKKEENGK